MKISARLMTAVFVPLIVTLIVGVALVYSYRAGVAARVNGTMVGQIRTAISDLNHLVFVYVTYHEERPKQQFLAAHDSLTGLIRRVRLRDAEQQRLLDDIRLNSQSMKELFVKLVSNTEKTGDDKLPKEAEERLQGQLLTRSYRADSSAALLRSLTVDDMGRIQKRTIALVFLVLILTTVPLTFLLARTRRGITASLAELRKGTEVIGSGDLEHRFAMRAKDELGDLARSFDAMTERLQAVIVSKDRLQREIEERVRAEEALRDSEQRWATTLSSIGDAVIATDVAGKVAFMNSVAQEMTGWRFEEALSMPVTEVFRIVNEQTRNEVENPVTKVLREGMVMGLANHTILVRKDGTELPIDDSGAPIKDADGTTRGVVLVFHDITERKQVEERTTRLASYPQLNPYPIIEVNASGEITFCNPGTLTALEDLGMGREECEAFLPEDLGGILRNWDKKTESTLHREVALKNRVFGETIHLVPQFNVARVYGLDITDRKLQENRIARLTRLYAVLSQVNEAIVRTRDEESLFSGVCRTVAEVGNFPLVWIGLVEGQQVLPVASWPQEADYLKEVKVEVEGELGRGPTGASIRENRPVINDDFATNPSTLPWHDAALRRGFHSSAAFPLRRQGKAVGSFTLYGLEPGAFDADQVGLLESLSADVSYALDAIEMERQRVRTGEALRKARDESEKRVQERTAELTQAFDKLMQETKERERLEAQLLQAQKMEALGTLTGGIAHDFNNILAAIIGFTELVEDHVPKESREAHHLKRVMESSLRGRDLVRQMLTYARKAEQEKKPLSLSTIVNDAVKLIRATTPTTISIKVDTLGESGLILADPTQMQQVVMNLCANAAHAMREKGGTLDIRVSSHRVSSSDGNPQGINPGLYTRLTVRDTGAGMPPDIMDKIFDPFFTTKNLGEGTGLGLSVVHGIVKQSNGHITVESEPGRGSVFTVYFPQIAGEPEVASVNDDEIPTGSERILFVDDEEDLVEMGEDVLAELGYEVTSRMSSREALALFKADPSRFDLVITDQTMPEMTGVELAKELLAIRPDMPIIMCTGFSYVVDANKATAAGIKAFAMKPLTRREIAKTIRKVLDE
jgi:PAS domain S-box-containing protein